MMWSKNAKKSTCGKLIAGKERFNGKCLVFDQDK